MLMIYKNILILVYPQKNLSLVWMMLLRLIMKFANISSESIEQILSSYLMKKEYQKKKVLNIENS